MSESKVKRYGQLKYSDGHECASLFGEREDGDYVLFSEAKALEAEVSRLTAELEAASKDAQRYRWLRPRIQIVRQGSVAKPNEKRAAIETRIGCSFIDSPLPYSTNPEHQEQLSLELDAAIDAAIKEGA